MIAQKELLSKQTHLQNKQKNNNEKIDINGRFCNIAEKM